MTHYAAGRLVDNCPHGNGWTQTRTQGEVRCDACGVRRFTAYGALRPPGLPQTITPAHRDPRAADRAAALNIALATRG